MNQGQLNFLNTQCPENVNPMVRAYGLLEPKRQCKDCVHLTYHYCAKRYYKCKLRRISYGPATDHRVRWFACNKFKEQDNIGRVNG